MRQTTGLTIVKPTAMLETKGPWVSMVLLKRFSVQFLQAVCAKARPLGALVRLFSKKPKQTVPTQEPEGDVDFVPDWYLCLLDCALLQLRFENSF